MKISALYFFITCLLIVNCSWGQRKDAVPEPVPGTILWKISGGDCLKPSYIVGTFHLTEADWLLKYPEMKEVIDSTEFILNEAYTSKPASPAKKEKPLKALPLLDKSQFNYLDSFFVARVGEGIRNNPEAEAMTIAEMEAAVVTTLISGSSGANGITRLMDKDLFDLYIKLGREGDRLDRVATTEFDSSEIDHAKQYLFRAINHIKNSDKPDWNIYQTEGIEDAVLDYKQMKINYRLDEYPVKVQQSDDFDFVPIEQRNKNWMPKMTDQLSRKPCLIAVGLGHLYYKTGIIMLLRSKGYTVEPVLLRKP
ncbi:TraB/GumN family protein [Dyadobacter diqingensis]|uniref:TraB/GumN family protein n=1 Tax=Dyadobacter diqingensis TaxID=2938121 RepID=UPI0020C1B161|nr:TraB/GumN family protein [Dyadobacter diqingensis]